MAMQLDDITPLILTKNEGLNLRDTLRQLSWARQILIVDSFSQDETLAIAAEFPQVRVLQRPFDHPTEQCNFGLSHVTTTWTLSLDADYKCSPEFQAELAALSGTAAGYRARFVYCALGRPLRGSLYPPRTVLYRTSLARYVRDGHTQRVQIAGEVHDLRTPLRHDDHKSLAVWLAAQTRYAAAEAEKLSATPAQHLDFVDRLRTWIFVVPVLVALYCLFWRRLVLDGCPGLWYTLQRVYAEVLLGLMLVDRRLRGTPTSPSPRES